jgi:hypothetical protein
MQLLVIEPNHANDSMTPNNKGGDVIEIIPNKNLVWKNHLHGIFQLPEVA